jgi:PAS domain S-box-containing protein
MKLTIRWALIVGFLCLIWGTYTVTTTSTFVSSQKVLNRHARDIMQNIAELAMEKSQNHLAHAQSAAVLTRKMLSGDVVSSNEDSVHTLEQYFLDQLVISPHFAGIYVGKPNGDFFYVNRSEKKSPAGFRTKIINHKNGIRKTRLIWRDKDLNIIAEELDPADSYDPRVRPWFKKALAQKKIVWTDPYIFFTSQKLGITIAGPSYDKSGNLKGVVGVDIEIDELSTFIGKLNIGKHGKAFMINNNGDVVAFPDLEKLRTKDPSDAHTLRLVKIHELDDILSREAFSAVGLNKGEGDLFSLDRSRFARFEHNGKYYHAMLTPFSIKQWPWIIGVHLPEDDYLGELKKNRFFNILLTLIISFIATVAALYFAGSIINPITNLEKEALAVKNDDLLTRFNIRSRYKEIQETANAFRLMKEAIRESQEKYRGIFENIQDVYFESSLDGKILEISPSINNLSTYKRETLLGQNAYQFYWSPEDRNEMIRTLTADEKISDYEVRLKGADHRLVYASLNSVLVTGDRDGKHKIIGSMRDITARKKAEAELQNYRERLEELVQERTADLEKTNAKLQEEMQQRLHTEAALGENKEKYRNILDSIEEGYFETDLRGHLVFCNDAMSDILGWSRDELLGTNLRTHADRDTAKKLQPIFREVYQTGRPCKAVELKIYTKDHSKRYIEMSIALVRSAKGKSRGFRGIGRDVTARRRAENERKGLEDQLQQAQRLKAVGTLAGGIAHDFNNLLMGIQGHVTLLLLAFDRSDSRYENVRSIERCVRSGADLTRQLLGYARGGKYVVKPTNLDDVVQTASNLFGRTKKETNIICECREDIWTVEVDRSQIEQVMVNLYLNAWQSMGQGGTIHVKIDNVTLDKNFVRPHEAAPGKYVRVSVMDTGTGMDEETQKRVFEPFFTTRSMGRGTGMGLASAFGIIKNHNGIIKFTSSVGEGTTFCIYLPATDHIVEKENAVKENVQIGRETILIVDDEQYVLDACEAMLSRLGYNIILTGSGEEAVERFRRDKDDIDLIILDMVMPGMDGPATYQHLIGIDPNVKVILSSGYSISNIAKEILDMGCDQFIQKPFRLGQISQIIRDLLDNKPES